MCERHAAAGTRDPREIMALAAPGLVSAPPADGVYRPAPFGPRTRLILAISSSISNGLVR